MLHSEKIFMKWAGLVIEELDPLVTPVMGGWRRDERGWALNTHLGETQSN